MALASFRDFWKVTDVGHKISSFSQGTDQRCLPMKFTLSSNESFCTSPCSSNWHILCNENYWLLFNYVCRSGVNRLPETSSAKIFGISRESKFESLQPWQVTCKFPLRQERKRKLGEGYSKPIETWLFTGWVPASFFLPLSSSIIAGIDPALFNWNFFLLIFLKMPAIC